MTRKVFPNLNRQKNNFEDFYNCLFGGEYEKECHNYVISSIFLSSKTV